MPSQAKPIPQGYHSVTPYLTLSNAARALDFYKRAFGAQEVMRMEGPGGKIGHAEIKIGDSMIMIADEMPESGGRSPEALGGSTGGVFLYVENADTVFNKAVSAGAHVEAPTREHVLGRSLRQAARSIRTLVVGGDACRGRSAGGNVETRARIRRQDVPADEGSPLGAKDRLLTRAARKHARGFASVYRAAT